LAGLPFDRLPEGLRLNEAGTALVPVAEQLEDAALSLERHRAAASSVLSGTVRISVGEWAAAFLTRHVGSSSENPPAAGVTLELVETFQTANLARREADLAVRHYPPESGDLYISKLGVFGGAVYRRIGSEARDWVTYPEEQGHFPMPRWVEQRVRETGASVALRASDMPMHLTAIRAGAGRGILPCFIADEDPLLERVAPPMPETSCEDWLIVHRDLRRAACVRAIMDWVQSLFRSERIRLAGLRLTHNDLSS
jgi:DNA-binding transcriptional LysR family regulator